MAGYQVLILAIPTVKVRAKVAAMPRVESGPSTIYWGPFDGFTNLDKFHDVDPPFAAFIFGDEGLRSTKALGELVLRQAGGFARPDHQLAESDLSCGMDRFAEFARAGSHRRRRLIRTSDYPKKGYI
jgi:hypothetical protein